MMRRTFLSRLAALAGVAVAAKATPAAEWSLTIDNNLRFIGVPGGADTLHVGRVMTYHQAEQFGRSLLRTQLAQNNAKMYPPEMIKAVNEAGLGFTLNSSPHA